MCAHPVQIQGMIDHGSDQCGTTGLRILSLAGRHMRAAAGGRPEQLPDFKPKLLQLCSTGSAAEAKAATRSAGSCCGACRASRLPVFSGPKAGPNTADPLLTSPQSVSSATPYQSVGAFCQFPSSASQSSACGAALTAGQAHNAWRHGCGSCRWSLHCSVETVT